MVRHGIGAIVQMAYLVEDIDQSIEQWLRLGVGPFFVTRHPKYKLQDYRGQEAFCDFSAAFAYSGDLQIELIEQHDETPSAFLEFKQQHGYGLQHLGVLSQDLAADTAKLAQMQARPFHRMVSALGVETVFFDLVQPGGAVLELIQATPALEQGFATMKEAARAWDGTGAAVHEF